MSKIVFIEMPAYGHINPSLTVVQELVRRGEQVVYYNTEEFKPLIEQTGAIFRAYPAGVINSIDIGLATQSGDLTRVVSVILKATETLLPFLLDELPQQQPDVLVLDSNVLWGHMAAKMLKLPTVSLMTTLMPNMKSLHLSFGEIMRATLPTIPSVPRVVAARIRLARRFGNDAFPKAPRFPARGDLNIALIPRDLQPDNPLIDDTFRFVGPTVKAEAKGSSPMFDKLDARPIVYISLGTLHLGSTDFFQQCFAAFGDMPAQFILSVGKQTDIKALGKIPANFTVQSFVPQLEVLQRASVFITHGGMNSVMEGLSFGVPMILIPQQFEQLIIGLFVQAKGAGLVLRGHISGKAITAHDLRQSLERIMGDTHYREAAGALQTSLRATGGYRQAADEIQTYIATVRGERKAS